MTDPIPAVEATVKEDASAVVADVKADVAKVETKVTTWYSVVFHPWLVHVYAAVAGYAAAHFSLVTGLLKLL